MRSHKERLSAIRLAMLTSYTLLGGAAAISIFGAIAIQSQSGPTFHLLIAALSLYLLVECVLHLRRSDVFGLLAPPFLASMLHFYLAYVMPSAGALLDPWILDRFAQYFSSQSDQLSETALLVGLAGFFMWRGYGLALPWARGLRRSLQRSKMLRAALDPSLLSVLVLQFGYFVLVASAISLGVFGMTGSVEQRERHLDLLELLNIGVAGGSLSLFLLLTFVFRRRAQGHQEPLLSFVCVFLICLHLLAGAMSGFKSQLVTPFVMLAFAKFIATRKISLAFIAAACVSLFVAYQVIEPFRAYIGSSQIQGASDVASMIEALQKSQEQKDLMHRSDLSWGTQVVSRSDLLGMTAVGIAFSTGTPLLSRKGEEFAESLYLSPALAYVPRALWPGKPSYASGVWFSNNALGKWNDTTTSVGMGPIAWLYILGGSVAVALGFLGIGMLQAIMFEGFGRAGAGGFIVFLAAMTPLVMIPTDVGPAWIGILRILPIAFVAQFFLLRAHIPFQQSRRFLGT